MGRLNDLDAKRDEIREQCPGWRVWYVPHSLDAGVTWCAQPEPVINADSPEALVEYIREAHDSGTHPALAAALRVGP